MYLNQIKNQSHCLRIQWREISKQNEICVDNCLLVSLRVPFAEHNVILLLIQSYNVNSIALISFCNDFLFVSFFSRNILFIHGKSEWAHARERSTHTWIFKTIWWCSFRLLPFAYFSSVLYNSRFFCEYFFSLSLPSSPCVCML